MDQHKPFVIVVDDDDEDRYLLSHCFSELGLQDNVKFFGDALQFIRYIQLIGGLSIRPSLFILDYRMPYMNGKAVVSYLKESSPFADTPVVILSGELGDDARHKLLQMGVTACYTKGDSTAALLNDLREMLQLATTEES